MIAGIVGHAAEKFTPETEAKARAIIRLILADSTGVSSGRSPMGGIDVWAEEEATALGIPKDRHFIFPPQRHRWDAPGGFKDRNLAIAKTSDIVHVIVVRALPPGYHGRRFRLCYHCGTTDHIKSGGCWTAHRAKAMGKRAEWHTID